MLRVKLHTNRFELQIEGDVDSVTSAVVKLLSVLEISSHTIESTIDKETPLFSPDTSSVNVNSSGKTTSSGQNSDRAISVDDIVELFRDVGRPLNGSEIYNMLIERGKIEPNPTGDTSYLRQIMRNDSLQRFTKTSGKKNALWVLKELLHSQGRYPNQITFDDTDDRDDGGDGGYSVES